MGSEATAHRGGALAFATMLLLVQSFLALDCVDGVTPDCSDAAAQCGPEEAGPDVGSVVVPDASPDGDASDATGDATDGAPGDAADAG